MPEIGSDELLLVLRAFAWFALAITAFIAIALTLAIGPFRPPTDSFDRSGYGIRVPNRPQRKLIKDPSTRDAALTRYKERVKVMLDQRATIEEKVKRQSFWRVIWVPLVAMWLASAIFATLVFANDFLFFRATPPLNAQAVVEFFGYTFQAIAQAVVGSLHMDTVLQTPLIPPSKIDAVGIGWAATFQRWIFGWAVPAVVQQVRAARAVPEWLTKVFAELEDISELSNDKLIEKFKAENYIQ